MSHLHRGRGRYLALPEVGRRRPARRVEYRKQRTDNPRSVEMHTTLSAHPFVLTLPPGRYTFTVERGKEYLPETRVVTVGKEPVDLKFKLRRWIDMAALGWYSGETHVHRSRGGTANTHARRGPQRRVPAVLLGDRGVRVAEDRPQGAVPGRRSEAYRGRSHARHLPAQHRVRDSSPSTRNRTRSARSSPSTTRPFWTRARRR